MIALKRFSSVFLAVCAASSCLISAAQAKFPDRPVHFIVGNAPGGGTDILARIVAAGLSEKWRQSVVVENKPGSSGVIAEDIVAHAPPDGYTVGWVTNDHTVTPTLIKQLNYDPVKSFIPLTQVAYVPDILIVTPTLQVKTLKELVAYAKSKPNQLNFGSPGHGSAPFLETGALMKLTGINMVHVPFQGGGAVVTAMLGGDVHLYFAALPTALPPVKSGKLLALAASANARAPLMPDVPTVAEALGLPSFDAANTDWTGTLLPAGVPKDIVDQMNKDFAEVLKSPETEKKLAEIGFVPVGDSSQHFSETIRGLMAKWPDIIKSYDSK